MIFVFVNKRNWKHPGPIVNVGVHNAHSLADLGYETHFCVGAGDESETSRDLSFFYGLAPCRELNIHRVERRQCGRSTSSLSIFRYAKRLISRLAERDQVVVISREGSFLPFMAWMARDPRVRCFYEAHDFFADLSWRPERPTFQDWKLCLFERWFLPQIEGVVAIVNPQAELYRAHFPKLPVTSLPLGTEPYEPGDPEARFALRMAVFSGHLHASKGIRNVLEAVSRPEDRLHAAVFGGSKTQIAKFEKGNPRVRFCPFRPPSAVRRDLRANASVGLVPLEENYYNARLTCPVKALDYLSHGLPIIASDLPTTRDVLGESAIYVPPGDTAALRRALLDLLGDFEEYRRRSQLSWERGLELSWEQRSRRLVEWISPGEMSATPLQLREMSGHLI